MGNRAATVLGELRSSRVAGATCLDFHRRLYSMERSAEQEQTWIRGQLLFC